MKQSSPDCLVASCGRFCVAQGAGQRKTPWRGLQRAATAKFSTVPQNRAGRQAFTHENHSLNLRQNHYAT
jgi:hypothetical protein